MKVSLTWGEKNANKTFAVKASSLKNAGNLLSKRGEWGRFQWDLRWNAKESSNRQVNSATLHVNSTISMPKWLSYSSQPAECKEEWDRMWGALSQHEDGHRKIFEEGISTLVRDLEAFDAPSLKELESLINKAKQKIHKQTSSYDARTEHGKTQGVSLDVAEKCKLQSKGKPKK